MAHTYAIAFDFPEGTVYAGDYKGAAGWAPTLASAWLFDSAEVALRTMKNAYGASADWARVVIVDRRSAVTVLR